jgi:hypothetical protein
LVQTYRTLATAAGSAADALDAGPVVGASLPVRDAVVDRAYMRLLETDAFLRKFSMPRNAADAIETPQTERELLQHILTQAMPVRQEQAISVIANMLHSRAPLDPPPASGTRRSLQILILAGPPGTSKSSLIQWLSWLLNPEPKVADLQKKCRMLVAKDKSQWRSVAKAAARYVLALTCCSQSPRPGRTVLNAIQEKAAHLPTDRPCTLYVVFDEAQAAGLPFFEPMKDLFENGTFNILCDGKAVGFSLPKQCRLVLVIVTNSGQGRLTADVHQRWEDMSETEQAALRQGVLTDVMTDSFSGNDSWRSRLAAGTLAMCFALSAEDRQRTVRCVLERLASERAHPSCIEFDPSVAEMMAAHWERCGASTDIRSVRSHVEMLTNASQRACKALHSEARCLTVRAVRLEAGGWGEELEASPVHCSKPDDAAQVRL